ncbi:uncharacterized protein TNCV_2844001 [Trichonephila clavipes]|nr:uncharacterized protein TNCV_2844001 [Trichonephila clavipes]
MKQLLSALLLIDVPLIAQAVKAVIATGVFISVSGLTGIGGAYSEILWLLLLAMVAEWSWSRAHGSCCRAAVVDTFQNCAATLDSLVLDYALPSAGLMLTIIIVEATMMYSAIKLWSSLRETLKVMECLEDSMVDQNVQMRNGTLRHLSYHLISFKKPSRKNSGLSRRKFLPYAMGPNDETAGERAKQVHHRVESDRDQVHGFGKSCLRSSLLLY